MTTFQRIFIGAFVALVPACGQDDATTGEVGIVQGRLVTADASATSASLVAIDDDGATTVIAEGAVTTDGRFYISSVPPGEGPFIVRVEGHGGLVGEVLVPGEVAAGHTTTTMPVDTETSVEARAYATLLAGTADREAIDVTGLMTWIDAELAAHADGAASLAAAWWSAQEGWLAVTGASARAASESRLDAWARLAARADAAGAITNDAWHDFVREAQADVLARLEVSAATHADAQAAAAVLFEAALSSDATLRDDAARVGATLSAHASWASQVAAASGSTAAAQVSARLDAAYMRFFDVIADADDRDAMAAAWLQLSGAISGRGSSDGASAALDLLVDAEGQADTSAVESALAATAAARARLEARLDAALAGPSGARAAAVASAFFELRADLEATIGMTLASGSDRITAFVIESAAQLQGSMGIIFDLDLIDDIDLGLTIVGDVAADIVAQVHGASLVAIDAGGAARAIAEGIVTGGQYRFEGVAATGATLVVELEGAAGELVGAAQLDAITATEGMVAGATVTLESTLEALVFFARMDGGERPSAIDMGTLELFIDGAIAAVATRDDDGAIEALAHATLVAELVAELSSTTTSERARAEAALAFELAVSSASSASAELVAAAVARAGAEAELAIEAALAHVRGSSLTSLAAVIDVALDGDLVGDVALALSLDVTAEATLRTAVAQAMSAGATFRASVGAAIAGSHTTGTDGLAGAWSAARATFDASVATALALPTVPMSEADHAALVTLVTHVAMASDLQRGR